MNRLVPIDAISVRLDETNARQLVSLYDVVVDGTDNVETRYILNDACFFEGRPLIYGAISRFVGQVSVFKRGKGPCYRCLFPIANDATRVPNCAESGVLGVLPGIIGTLQANETLKILLGIGKPLYGEIAIFDAMTCDLTKLHFERDPECALCGEQPEISDVHAIGTPVICDINGREVLSDQIDRFFDEHPSAIVLDMRELHERVERWEGALEISASTLLSQLDRLDIEKTYLLICQVGLQSKWAVERLTSAGFVNVYHLQGGFAQTFYESTFGIG